MCQNRIRLIVVGLLAAWLLSGCVDKVVMIPVAAASGAGGLLLLAIPLVFGIIGSPESREREEYRRRHPQQVESILPQDTPLPPANAQPFYTARQGDSMGRVLAILGSDPQAISALNPEIMSRGWMLRAGERVFLPESTFAFVTATGRETYRDLARRHRMTTDELRQLSGRWSDHEIWAFTQSASECASEGCPWDLEPVSPGERFLVRVP